MRISTRRLPSGRDPGWSEDEQRTARLLFDAELRAGSIPLEALHVAAVDGAVRVGRVPPRPVRVAQQLMYKLGGPRVGAATVRRAAAARRAVCESGQLAPPRVLVRVDEFPHYQAWDRPERFGGQRYARFHEILASAGVPYLLAVPPRVSRQPLSPTVGVSRELDEGERALLERLAGEGVVFALHGRDHRTRFASPRRHAELCGLARSQTEQLVDRALAELAPLGIAPNVFVPPFNRFDARQLPWLARRFEVVCGGPESIGTMGLQSAPQWRGDAVYLPSYAPFYGRAGEVLAALPAIARASGVWLAVVLHWGWEADAGWGELEQLAQRIAPFAAPWTEFLAAVERSR